MANHKNTMSNQETEVEIPSNEEVSAVNEQPEAVVSESVSESKPRKKSEFNVEQRERTIERQLRAQPKVLIRIPRGRDSWDSAPVPVGVNGYSYLIKRDEDVWVPQAVVEVLKSAEEEVPVVVEENGQRRTVFRKAQRIPFMILKHENE